MYTSTRCLKVTRRPKACLGWRDGTNVPGMPLMDGSKRCLQKEDVADILLTSWAYGACLASGASRMLRAMHAAHKPLAVDGRWKCYVEDTARLGNLQESAIVHAPFGEEGFQNPASSVRRVILSRSNGQAELQQGHTHECNPPKKIARYTTSWPSGLVSALVWDCDPIASNSELSATTWGGKKGGYRLAIAALPLGCLWVGYKGIVVRLFQHVLYS